MGICDVWNIEYKTYMDFLLFVFIGSLTETAVNPRNMMYEMNMEYGIRNVYKIFIKRCMWH